MTQEKTEIPHKDQTGEESYLDLQPIRSIRTIVAIVVISCLLLGIALSTFVEQNTKSFWEFARTVSTYDIAEIIVQRVDFQGNEIGDSIIIRDSVTISNFVSALKTIQPYQANHPISQDETRVTVNLNNGETIEFVCYTLEGEGRTIFVGDIFIRSSLYEFGNGNAQFPGTAFYDWLTGVGIGLHP